MAFNVEEMFNTRLGGTVQGANALGIIATQQIPKRAYSTHPGPGGKTLTYLSHVWITSLLQAAFGSHWSFSVEEIIQFPDESIAARCTLAVFIPDSLGGSDMFVCTELGTFKAQEGKEGKRGMNLADVAASAVSRGLARCAMRMFGLGIDLYEEETIDDQDLSPNGVLKLLMSYANRHGISNDQLTIILRNAGVTKNDLVAYSVIAWRALINEIARVRAGGHAIYEDKEEPDKDGEG